MIRVLIADDSITQREILCRIVHEDEEMIVVGEARDGTEAVRGVRELSPDVVLMDVHMEQMNGLEATRQIMRENPVPVVIISSTLRKRDINFAVEAMRIGAVMAIEKPKGAALLHMPRMSPRLRQVLREAAATKVRKIPSRVAGDPQRLTEQYRPPARPVKVIGICSSAGGPSVLVEILSALPRHYPIPVLLVQHLSAGFQQGFAEWLTQQTSQPAKVVTEGQKLVPGIWLGGTGKHVVLKTPSQIGLSSPRPEDIHCPAGDPMFKSIAQHHASSAVGVVLTGMGDDGARGLLAIKEAGGQTIVQDEATAMVWGMPQAAKKVDASDYELNPRAIADALCRLARI